MSSKPQAFSFHISSAMAIIGMSLLAIVLVYFSARTISVFYEYRIFEYSSLSSGELLSVDEFRHFNLLVQENFPEISIRNTCAKINYGNVLNQNLVIPSSKYRLKGMVLVPYFRYFMSERRGFSLVLSRTNFRRFREHDSIAENLSEIDRKDKLIIMLFEDVQ